MQIRAIYRFKIRELWRIAFFVYWRYTWENFHTAGKLPELRDAEKIKDNGIVILECMECQKMPGKLSEPAAA